MQKKSLLILLFLYILASGLSFGAYSLMHKGKSGATSNQASTTTPAGQAGDDETGTSALGQLLQIDPSEPKTAVCPLNGAMYTAKEQAAWQAKRPLAVMIENHPDARPQSGLSNADEVFEAMAEGGVTRFMALFYCNVQANDVTLAPIRSARTYFVDYASGFNLPLYVHVGGANTPGPADALGQLTQYGWTGANDLNQFSIGYPTFVRDYSRLGNDDIATEHTMVTSTEKLWAVGAKRGWTNKSPDKIVAKKTVPGKDWAEGYKPDAFQDGKPGSGSVNKISFEFWTGFHDYSVEWDYDAASNSYKRVLAGAPHIDHNTNQQLAVKNAVVLFADEKGPIDDKKHMLYGTTGTGDALIFQNGDVIKAKWAKKDRESQLTFTTEKGKPVEWVRGPIWISIVAKKTTVQY